MAILLDHRGNPIPPQTPTTRQAALARLVARFGDVRARYDAAQTTSHNANHWAGADALSAAAAASPAVRLKLRNRARYERDNNCYCLGMILTLANDLVGTGPRLQLHTPVEKLNRAVQFEFARWARRVKLAQKLRTARMAKAVDGEVFLEFITNPGLKSRVKLDLKLIEAEQVATPDLDPTAENAVDGIVFDAYGNPLTYHRLRRHPGDLFADLRYDRIPASRMIHLFRAERPGQVRGIPEITAALPLFADLRRYTGAVIASAETAADFAAVLYTDSPQIDPDEIPNLSLDEGLPIDKRMFQVLPNGWKMAQLQAEQPTTLFGDFRAAILSEAGRAETLPRNVSTGDSSNYNYASGRLDRQGYNRSLAVERDLFEDEALDPIFDAWLDEALLIPDYLPDEAFVVDEMAHGWAWDGDEHVDPTKETTAERNQLDCGTNHRARLYAKRGLDVDEEDAKAAASYGVTVAEYRRALFRKHLTAGSPAASGDGKDAEEQDDEEERAASPAGRQAA